jgi:two-component system NarL family sensor kinase
MANWQKPETLAIWLGIGLTVIVLLITSIILFTRVYVRRIMQEQSKRARLRLEYQKDLLQDSIRVQERERNRIAANLHDELISKLNILLLTLYQGDPAQNTTQELLKESIGVARRISHDLSPPLLGETDLPELITDFVSPLQRVFKVHYHVSRYSDRQIDNETKLQLFRVIQEIISNIIRHAQAQTIDINIRISDRNLSLCISDDGIGLKDVKSKGLGHKNIELRVQLLKGKYRFSPTKPQGTQFLMHLSHY